MADRTYGPHDYGELANKPPNAPTGAVRIYGKGGKLYCVDASGNHYDLTLGKTVRYYETTTNGSGQWSVNYSGDFSQVEFVAPQAIHETGDISEQKFASLHRFDNSSANGRVVESNAIVTLLLGGGQGLEYSEAGVRVRVRVEGVVNL